MQKNNSFKPNIYILLANPFRLTFFTLFGFLCFAQVNCSKRADSPVVQTEIPQVSDENKLNINLASAAELEKLPKIGEETARRIVEYREKNGKFRRVENLILVNGMTDKKFREIKNLVKAE